MLFTQACPIILVETNSSVKLDLFLWSFQKPDNLSNVLFDAHI